MKINLQTTYNVSVTRQTWASHIEVPDHVVALGRDAVEAYVKDHASGIVNVEPLEYDEDRDDDIVRLVEVTVLPSRHFATAAKRRQDAITNAFDTYAAAQASRTTTRSER